MVIQKDENYPHAIVINRTGVVDTPEGFTYSAACTCGWSGPPGNSAGRAFMAAEAHMANAIRAPEDHRW